MSKEDRQRFFEQAREYASLVSVDTADGLRFVVSTRDLSVGRLLFIGRKRGEMQTLHRALAILRELEPERDLADSLFVDVGANIGTTTIPAVVRHGFAGAVAFEPEPMNFRLLQANALLNGIGSAVQAVQIALSDRVGETELELMPTNSGGHRVRSSAAEAEANEVVRVRTTTLDALVQEGVLPVDRVGMLWIDVQGHEGHVLAGGGRFLEGGPPTVVEFYPRLLAKRRRLEQVYATAGLYSHVVDLRQPEQGPRPVDELRALAERLADPACERRFTDLLLLRLAKSRVTKSGQRP